MSNPLIRTLQIGDEWFEDRQGGLGRVYFELFRHLPEVGVDFRGLVVGTSKTALVHRNKIELLADRTDSLANRLVKARRHVKQELRCEAPDLLVAHFALYAFPILWEIGDIPFVVHFHGPWAAESNVERSSRIKSHLQFLVEKTVYRRATRIVTLSHSFARELTRRYGISEDVVNVVPAGVDVRKFNCTLTRQQARDQLGWARDRFVVVAVRRLAHRMGLENLLSAAKRLVRKHPELLVYIIGGGTLAKELQQRIDDFGLAGNVALLGPVDEAVLPLAYRAANLSIVPSIALEGFGMITLESLASGTPVMVTPIGGMPEIVRKLSPALLFEGADANSITSGLGEALNGLRQLPSEAECRSYVESNFTWSIAANRIRQTYLDALACKSH